MSSLSLGFPKRRAWEKAVRWVVHLEATPGSKSEGAKRGGRKHNHHEHVLWASEARVSETTWDAYRISQNSLHDEQEAGAHTHVSWAGTRVIHCFALWPCQVCLQLWAHIGLPWQLQLKWNVRQGDRSWGTRSSSRPQLTELCPASH